MLVLVMTWGRELPGPLIFVVAGLLAAAVLAAVHHAEVVAHKVGEPYGSLVLAVAVTVIEVGLIVTLMISGGDKTQALARDTVFAAVMITCNGILGLSLLLGALRRGGGLQSGGHRRALATVATLATLSMVVPTFTTSRPGPEFSPAQLAFAAVASLALYLLFVMVQTGRHRDYFLPVTQEGSILAEDKTGDGHAEPPSTRTALASLALLVVALVAVVGDANGSPRRSRRRSARRTCRRRSSAWSSRCWCCCRRRSPRLGRPGGTGYRSASTSRSVRPWPASA
ncbi:hypothetical protein V2I01_11655 [Micromonospora sp. BRA006-A]|nr:hypothetical protein [Micromonospora sp. BRA006-A]